MKIKTHKEL